MEKTYITIPVSSLDGVDFDQLITTDASSATKNTARDTAIVKWRGTMPQTIADIALRGTPMTYEQVCDLLNTAEWAQEV